MFCAMRRAGISFVSAARHTPVSVPCSRPVRRSLHSTALRASADAGSSGATQGQITAALMASMRSKISAALETEQVQVVDTSGDGRHVAINVISPAFEGKSAVKRQQLVYKAIWEELQEAVHAVDSMTTKTPDEAGQ